MADAFTNFARSTLVGGLAPATTTLTVQAGDGALFPVAGGGQTFRFVLQNSANQREVCICTLRTGDVFNTITRNAEGTLALTWNVGDRVGHRLTAAQLNNILVSSDLQQNTKTWCGTAGGTANALTLTPAPAITAMVAGHKLIFKTGALPNTTAVTIAVSGLATFAVQNSGVALVPGALTANTWWEVLYDGVAGQLKKYVIGIETAVLTAKGSLLAASASNIPVERTVGSDGQALSADSSQTSGLVYIDNPSRPNLLINPNWLLDQINEGALYTIGASTQGPDGWTGSVTGTGVIKLRTVVDPDNAALKCLEISCTTLDAAIAAGDAYYIQTAIEGYDTTSLMVGTASAQPITVQFKFKTNVTGVYGISIVNAAVNRSYIGVITVVDTNEHEYSLTLTMDTTGTWLYTSGVGLFMTVALAAGSTFQTTAGTWQAGNFRTTAAQCNFMSSTSNIAYLKRVQLIPGALVQAYHPADIHKELAKAQRYYEKSWDQGTPVGTAVNAGSYFSYIVSTASNFTNYGVYLQFATGKRITAVMTGYSPVSGSSGKFYDVANTTDVNSNFVNQGTRGSGAFATFTGAATAQIYGHWTANVRLS